MPKPCILLRSLSECSFCYTQDDWLVSRVEIVGQYDLSAPVLRRRRALILTLALDQRHMLRHKDLLTDFVTAGGTVIFQGQVSMPFLDGLTPYVPALNLAFPDFDVTFNQPHPILRGTDPAGLNIRHGVRGFYSHGSNPPPPDARIITSIRQGTVPVDWQMDIGRGRVFVHSGNDFTLTYEDRGPNIALTRKMVAWAIGEEKVNDQPDRGD